MGRRTCGLFVAVCAMVIGAVIGCGPGSPDAVEYLCSACDAAPALAPDAPDAPDVRDVPREECNEFDDDGDGEIDEGCPCEPGTTQACYPGDPTQVGLGRCTQGVQTCAAADEFASWSTCVGAVLPVDEVCDGEDNDCDGVIDDLATGEPCQVRCMAIEIDGDCVTVDCPPELPYPWSCDIAMEGGDDRGCVASVPTASTVYFQEGDRCGAGRVVGTLCCSANPGTGLDASTCPINKSEPLYPASADGCPRTFF